jgi:thymidylate synthase ThyX
MLPKVKIIADSIYNGARITTMQLEYWRAIHAEFMTHRAFSRNASSSRAIPTKILSALEIIEPVRYGVNKPGMQPGLGNLSGPEKKLAREIWMEAANHCLDASRRLAELGLHKQWANRMIEWLTPISVVVTATDWDNFFELRCDENSQDEIRILAEKMKAALKQSDPQETSLHCPYAQIQNTGISWVEAMMISAARCARVSYLNHDGSTPSVDEDLQLAKRLLEAQHMSPFEHAATSMPGRHANMFGWAHCRDLMEYKAKRKEIMDSIMDAKQ